MFYTMTKVAAHVTYMQVMDTLSIIEKVKQYVLLPLNRSTFENYLKNSVKIVCVNTFVLKLTYFYILLTSSMHNLLRGKHT